jgi:hypothetical protein
MPRSTAERLERIQYHSHGPYVEANCASYLLVFVCVAVQTVVCCDNWHITQLTATTRLQFHRWCFRAAWCMTCQTSVRIDGFVWVNRCQREPIDEAMCVQAKWHLAFEYYYSGRLATDRYPPENGNRFSKFCHAVRGEPSSRTEGWQACTPYA